MHVGDLMEWGLDLFDDLMNLRRIRHMPIVSARQFVGIVSTLDGGSFADPRELS
jgi:hypothetical protein